MAQIEKWKKELLAIKLKRFELIKQNTLNNAEDELETFGLIQRLEQKIEGWEACEKNFRKKVQTVFKKINELSACDSIKTTSGIRCPWTPENVALIKQIETILTKTFLEDTGERELEKEKDNKEEIREKLRREKIRATFLCFATCLSFLGFIYHGAVGLIVWPFVFITIIHIPLLIKELFSSGAIKFSRGKKQHFQEQKKY